MRIVSAVELTIIPNFGFEPCIVYGNKPQSRIQAKPPGTRRDSIERLARKGRIE